MDVMSNLSGHPRREGRDSNPTLSDVAPSKNSELDRTEAAPRWHHETSGRVVRRMRESNPRAVRRRVMKSALSVAWVGLGYKRATRERRTWKATRQPRPAVIPFAPDQPGGVSMRFLVIFAALVLSASAHAQTINACAKNKGGALRGDKNQQHRSGTGSRAGSTLLERAREPRGSLG